MIRRPLLFAAVGFTAAVLAAYYLGVAAAAAAAIIILPGAYITEKVYTAGMTGKRRRAALILLLFYIAGVFCFWLEELRLDREAEELISSGEKNDLFVGKITDSEKKVNGQGETYVEMTVKSSAGKALIKCYKGSFASDEGAESVTEKDSPGNKQDREMESLAQKAVPGKYAEVTCELQKPQGRRNPGCFDYALYLRSIGITATAAADTVKIYGSGGIRGKLFLMKEAFIREIDVCTDADTAATVKAIMFGDKGELDDDTLEVFQRNGTAHILAVSGLHIGIIYAFLLRIWRWRRGWCFFSFAAAFFGCYSAMTGFSPSVVRAVLMILMHIYAQITGNRYDLNNAALAVATAILIRGPYMLFNAGFQMSFLAVLTMSLVLPYINHFYSGVLTASLAIQTGLGPFILFEFNYLSVAAAFINVPVVALTGLIVPLGLTAMVLQKTVFFFPLAEAVEFLCNILEFINRAVEVDGFTTFQVASPPLWAMAFYYLGLLMFATEEGRLAVLKASEKLLYVCRMLCVLTALALLFSFIADDGFDDCDITFVDVGQGDCVCIRVDGGLPGKEHCYLIDGGGSPGYSVGKQILRPYLLKNGIRRVDKVFVTHLHTDHFKGICELAEEGMVDKLCVYEGNSLCESRILRQTGLQSGDIEYMCAGEKIQLSEDDDNSVILEVLWPERKTASEYENMLESEEDENEMSLIFRLSFCGDVSAKDEKTGDVSVLITGDMDESGEARLISRYQENLHSDILKVGHHGSKYSTSSAFLEAVRPAAAVIQVGKNNYGHPAQETLARLSESGVYTYRNDTQGAIGFEISRGRVRNIRTMIE